MKEVVEMLYLTEEPLILSGEKIREVDRSCAGDIL
jgi:hypothetical protein